MKKRRFSRDDNSLLIMAINSKWQFSAILAFCFFVFAYIVIPNFGSKSAIIPMVIMAFKPFIVLFGGVFVLIAIFNYFRQSKSASNASNQTRRAIVRNVPHAASKVVPFRRKPGSEESEPHVFDDWSKIDTKLSNPSISGLSNTTQRPMSWSIELLQKIEWKLFEDLSAAYFKEKGIRAELTKLGADGGIDIKLFEDDSGKPTSLVQCKAWNTKLVGVKPIREHLGVMTSENAKGLFMATGAYTQEATEFAKANGIMLIDGKNFLAMIQQLSADAQQRLLDCATVGDYTTPSCPSCGIKLLRRSSIKGDFWGCSNYPRCRQMLHVKVE
jgi:restriction system protein